MSDIFYQPKSRIISNDGSEVGAGYKFYFYQTLTDTPITTYSNPGLTIANSNPVLADAYGYLTPIYVADFSQVKVVVKDADGNLIYTVDPVNPSGSSSITLNDLGIRPTSYWGVTTGTSTAYSMAANPPVPSYSNVQTFIFQCHLANGANPTLDIDGLGALNLKKYTGQGTKVALQAGDMQATQRYLACNDGVDIIILNPRSLPLNTGTPPTLTIAAGVITLTNGGSNYLLETEGAAATDDLETINGLNDGEVVFLQIANDAHNVIIKQTGNIFIQNGIDITLDLTTDVVGFKYNATLAKAVLITSASSASGMVLLATKTAAASATLEFTSGINSVYSKYVFDLHGVYPATNQVRLQMQVSEDGGSNWKSGATDYYSTTNMASVSGIAESGGNVALFSISDYNAPSYGIANNAAGALNGSFALFDPSSSGNVKKIVGSNSYDIGGVSYTNNYSGSYKATTNPINAVKFFMSSGNIAVGTIKMFGVL